MTDTPHKPATGAPAEFGLLGEDLAPDLDSWDKGLDALFGSEPGSPEGLFAAEPDPSEALGPSELVARVEQALDQDDDDFSELAVDRVFAVETRVASERLPTQAVDDDAIEETFPAAAQRAATEADFSELGVSAPVVAIGDILGTDTGRIEAGAPASPVVPSAPHIRIRPMHRVDDEVVTSAPRLGAPPPPPGGPREATVVQSVSAADLEATRARTGDPDEALGDASLLDAVEARPRAPRSTPNVLRREDSADPEARGFGRAPSPLAIDAAPITAYAVVDASLDAVVEPSAKLASRAAVARAMSDLDAHPASLAADDDHDPRQGLAAFDASVAPLALSASTGLDAGAAEVGESALWSRVARQRTEPVAPPPPRAATSVALPWPRYVFAAANLQRGAALPSAGPSWGTLAMGEGGPGVSAERHASPHAQRRWQLEAARVAMDLGTPEVARQLWEHLLVADSSALEALRGLRGVALADGDAREAVRLLDLEQLHAGPVLRELLARYQLNLLMATEEHDVARVVVGEVLDRAPQDVHALLAELELALGDSRITEFAQALQNLAEAVDDASLRASLLLACADIAELEQRPDAEALVSEAYRQMPSRVVALWRLSRAALARGEAAQAAMGYATVAGQLAGSEGSDALAMALRGRAHQLGDQPDEAWRPLDDVDAYVAFATAPADVAARARLAQHGDEALGGRWLAWQAAQQAQSPAAWLAAAPANDWLAVGQAADGLHQPGFDAADFRAAMANHSHPELAPRWLLAAGALPPAGGGASLIARLGPLAQLPESATTLRGVFADRGDGVMQGLAALTGALAHWHAVLSAYQASPSEVFANVDGIATRWQMVVADRCVGDVLRGGLLGVILRAPSHSAIAAMVRGVKDGWLRDAQTTAQLRWALADGRYEVAAELLAQARSEANAAAIARRGAGPDPRQIALAAALAMQTDRIEAYAIALEDFAAAVETRGEPEANSEAALIQFRAAELFADSKEPQRAAALMAQVASVLPWLSGAHRSLATLRRRAGLVHAAHDVGVVDEAARPFVRAYREAEARLAQGDGDGAARALLAALEARPRDPLALGLVHEWSHYASDVTTAVALALAQLSAAEASGEPVAQAVAHQHLGMVEWYLRGDREAALVALRAARALAPSRFAPMAAQAWLTLLPQDLLELRLAQLAVLAAGLVERGAYARDAGMIGDAAGLAPALLRAVILDGLELESRNRGLLVLGERYVRGSDPIANAKFDDLVAGYFASEPGAAAALLTRAGEAWVEAGDLTTAIARFRAAEAALPAYVPALFGWRSAALRGELWLDVANVAIREAVAAHLPVRRAELFHFAGVVFMDRCALSERAIEAFRHAVAAQPTHADAFARLWRLLDEGQHADELAIALSSRLEVTREPAEQARLHFTLAGLADTVLGDREGALAHLAAVAALVPQDVGGVYRQAELMLASGRWPEGVRLLEQCVAMAPSEDHAAAASWRIGDLLATHQGAPQAALAWFERYVNYDLFDPMMTRRAYDVAVQHEAWALALACAERLLQHEPDPVARVPQLHRLGFVVERGYHDSKRAERAYHAALDGAPGNLEALQRLIAFYQERNDTLSVRVHVGRVIAAMRTRLEQDPRDAEAYGILAQTFALREAVGVMGSSTFAHTAAQFAQRLGAATADVPAMGRAPAQLDALRSPDGDESLFPFAVQRELRQVLHAVGDRLAKHAGADLRAHGLTRADRQPNHAEVVREANRMAVALGLGEVEVYVTSRQPWVITAEPLSPLAVVLGSAVVEGELPQLRFALGMALKLAQTQLGLLVRQAPREAMHMVWGLGRLFQPELAVPAAEEAAVAAQAQKLRRLLPSSLVAELRPFGLVLDAERMVAEPLLSGIALGGYRAGLVAAGGELMAFELLARMQGLSLEAWLATPIAPQLVGWWLSEDAMVFAGG